MNDIEPAVFTAIKELFAALGATACHGRVTVRSTFRGVTEDLPLCTVEETDSAVHTPTLDSGGKENHTRLTYEVSIYSNSKTDKRGEARAILSAADGVLQGFGFTRVYCRPTPNLADASIFRLTARYEGVLGTDGVVYRP